MPFGLATTVGAAIFMWFLLVASAAAASKPVDVRVSRDGESSTVTCVLNADAAAIE